MSTSHDIWYIALVRGTSICGRNLVDALGKIGPFTYKKGPVYSPVISFPEVCLRACTWSCFLLSAVQWQASVWLLGVCIWIVDLTDIVVL